MIRVDYVRVICQCKKPKPETVHWTITTYDNGKITKTRGSSKQTCGKCGCDLREAWEDWEEQRALDKKRRQS